MQQVAGHIGLINPFVFNQFGYGTYAQVRQLFIKLFYQALLEIDDNFQQYAPLNTGLMSQQAALAACTQGAYISPVTGLPTAGPLTAAPTAAINGLTSAVVTPTTGEPATSLTTTLPQHLHTLSSRFKIAFLKITKLL